MRIILDSFYWLVMNLLPRNNSELKRRFSGRLGARRYFFIPKKAIVY